MVKLTASLQKWLWDNNREILPLIVMGHTELFTDEMWEEYMNWCQTDEGKRYLEGGDRYTEPA